MSIERLDGAAGLDVLDRAMRKPAAWEGRGR
jgi:hypothetical protein